MLGVTFLCTLCMASISSGQYFGERVLEKSFESTDFFFQPIYLNPYGLGSFARVTPGLIDDPLLNLQLNPALLYADSTRRIYMYMDFRNSRTIEDDDYYVQPAYGTMWYENDMLYYPRFYMRMRQELEPIFSYALLTRPVAGLFAGLSYQALFRDEKYYAIPQDIYRSTIGYDYRGNVMDETADMPIIDRYSGADNMHQRGHFLTLYSGYELSRRMQLGAKISRALYDRDGSYGSNNFWDYAYQYDNTSVYYSYESREQNYDHWDVGGGINMRLAGRWQMGLSGGYIWGNADQEQILRDSSLYTYGEVDVDPEWHYYRKLGSTAQRWGHDGSTAYAGIQCAITTRNAHSLRFYYQFSRSDIDLLLASTASDTSFSSSQSVWNQEYYRGLSYYGLYDFRSGEGSSSIDQHRLALAMTWQVEHNKKIQFGLNVGIRNRTVATREAVRAHRHSYYFYESTYYPDGDEYYAATVEDKILHWDFDAQLLEIQIPVLFHWRISSTFELLFGINRKMSSWEINDVTLALFNFRRETFDTTTTTRTNFGERYTQPRETMSEVQTAVLGGVTISPSRYFDIRLLFVPNFTDTYAGATLKEFQWWLGLNVYP